MSCCAMAYAAGDWTASAPDDGVDCNSSVMKPMYVMASLSVSIRDRRFSYANVGTLRRSLSNASFRLYMRLRSRMLAARRCASVATRLRIFFDDAIDDFCELLPLLLLQTCQIEIFHGYHLRSIID